MSFHNWLEKLTEELRENSRVQRRAYFRKDTPILEEPQGHKHIVPLGATEDFQKYCFWDEDEECWMAYCRACGEPCDIVCTPEEFFLDNHFCGRNPHCIP